MPKGFKARRTMLGTKPNAGRVGKRPVKLATTDRKQRVRLASRRRGGR